MSDISFMTSEQDDQVNWKQEWAKREQFFDNEYDTCTDTPIAPARKWTGAMIGRWSQLMKPEQGDTPVQLSPEQESAVRQSVENLKKKAREREREDYEEWRAKWDAWEASGSVGPDPKLKEFYEYKVKWAEPAERAEIVASLTRRGVIDYLDLDGIELEPTHNHPGTELAEPHELVVPSETVFGEFDGEPESEEKAVPLGHDDPIDIFGSLSPKPVLQRDFLPRAIADFGFDEAERMGVEPATVAIPALVVCAAAIDDRIRIQPKAEDTRWTESARLWLALVGEPGVGKSPALNKAVEPCREIEQQWRVEDAAKFSDYQRQMEDYKYRKAEYDKARRKGEECDEPQEPEEPRKRRLLVNEMSMEGLAERILAYNERGVMVLYQELMGLIGGFDAYKNNGVKKDRTAALELFDGGPRNRDLVRDTVWVPNWSACIVGGIQTDKLAKAAPTLTDDGLLQRFFLVEVHSTGMGEDRRPDMDAVQAYDWLVRELTALRPEYFGDPIVLSAEAQVYRREVQALAFALKEEATLPPAFRGHANKLTGMYARLLLTLHLIETPHRRTDLLGTVTGETAKRARDLMVKFFIPHALYLYSRFFGEGASDARWIAGHVLAHKSLTVKARDLKRANKSFKENPGKLYEAIERLAEYNWLTPILKSSGEASTEWTVNPLVHSQYIARAEYETEARKAATANATKQRKIIRECLE